MATGIPLPGQPGTSFMKGIDTGSTMFSRIMQPIVQRENMSREWQQHLQDLEIQKQIQARAAQLQPLQMKLLMAQAQQAQAAANKANMWSSLLSGDDGSSGMAQPSSAPSMGNNAQPTASGLGPNNIPLANAGMNPNPIAPTDQPGMTANGPPMQPSMVPQASPGQEMVLAEGNPRLHGLDRVAGLQGMPNVQTHYDDNGNLITRFPSGKITMMPVSPNKASQVRASEFAKGDAKIANEMTEMIPNGADLLRTYSRLDQSLADPEWRKMQDSVVAKFGTDTGRKATLAMYKQAGTPQQKELIGKVQNLTRDIITKSASVFKGTFRVAEQSLLEAMKPSENDPVDVALAKLHEMQKSLTFQQFVNTRVPMLIRNGMSPQDAFNQVFTESGADKFISGLEDKYGTKTGNTSTSTESFDWSKYPVAGQ